MKILLISHGDLAAGMCSTITNFFGASTVSSACVTLDRGTADLTDKIDGYLKEWEGEQVVICSDLKGGSANQTAYKYLERPNTYLISGMNLALILQLIMEQQVSEESLRTMIDSAKQDMVLINDLYNQASFESNEDE
jgi:Phosphotransferase system, mannose/fructose-specific component IIA